MKKKKTKERKDSKENKYPDTPESEENNSSFYWDDNEDSEGYKEDGKSNYFNETFILA